MKDKVKERLSSWIPQHYTGLVMPVISMFLKAASSERPGGKEVKKYSLMSGSKITHNVRWSHSHIITILVNKHLF